MGNVDKVVETVKGQPQVRKAPEQVPFDGKVKVSEVRVTTDEVVLDPNSPEAVQVPEGVGASADDFGNPGEVYEAGTPEEQFEASKSDEDESKSEPSE